MRKIFVSIVMAGTVLLASPYTRENRIHDMQEMAHAMNTIQSGFFYNNYDTISAGVEALSDAIRRVEPPLEEMEEKDLMTRWQDRKVQMTDKIVKTINRRSLDILERYKDGDSTQAVQAYTKILGQCMKCHRETRHW